MKSQETDLLTFFHFPIEQFADRSTRWLLEDSENVRGLLEIVAEHLVGHLDFTRLVHINRSFIPDNLREQESDVVYTVPFRDASKTQEVLIYILIEHQSTVDVTMGFRLLFYMTQIWDFQRRDWESKNIPRSQRKLHPIIPIVFYTGDQRWSSPLTLQTMMDLPDLLSGFVPTFDTLFLGVKETDPADLTRTEHPLGWLLRVLQKEHASKQEIRTALMEAVRHIDTLDTEHAQQWQQAIFYLYLLILHRRPAEERDELTTLVQQHIQEPSRREEGTAMAQTIAEQLIEQGIERGARENAINNILTVLCDRFPETDADIATQKLESILDLARLEQLLLTAVNTPNFETFLQALEP